MNKKLIYIYTFAFFMVFINNLTAQISVNKFGSGIDVIGKDSSFYANIGLRIQSQFSNNWTLTNDNISLLDNHEAEMLIRRSRIKMDGWIFNPQLSYKFELGLSNRDMSGAGTKEFGNSSNVLYDAVLKYKFYKNLSIQYGQTKLPGNRERIISSGNLQFVDRSLLNSRFNLDRDIGFQIKNQTRIGKQFYIQETFAFSQGEGRNIVMGNFNGFEYTGRIEFFPFGKFTEKGDYIGSAVVREKTPKLALAFVYDNNNNAVRTRGNLGDFIVDDNGKYYGKNLQTFFVDMMLKYKKISVMAEYAIKKTSDNDPNVYNDTMAKVGTFITGTGLNAQMGYMFDNNIEIAARATFVNVNSTKIENQYTFGVSKFIVGHKLKIQTDLTYLQKDNTHDGLMFRMQMDIHF